MSLIKKTNEERRESERFEKIFIAQCNINNHKSFSTAFNLSKTGIGIYIDKYVKKGSSLTITLQYEYKDGSYDSNKLINLSFPAKVIWIIKDEVENNKISSFAKEFSDHNVELYLAGLIFDNLSKETAYKLNQLLNEK